LESAVDPEMDDDLRSYHELAAIPASKRTAVQRHRYVELSAKLTQARLLGNTWRERLALEAAGAEIERLRVINSQPVDGKSLDQRAVESISQFLRKTASPRPRRTRAGAA
jgi:hypothetical protein